MIAKEGMPFLGIGIGLTVLLYWLFGEIGASIGGILTLAVAYFFRDPPRKIPAKEGIVVSPADGKILEVTQVNEDRFLKRPAQKITIFLSVFNVHINRMPVSGRIKNIYYNPGKFLMAYAPKASLENEQNAVWLEGEKGREFLVVQIAGWIARRIVCKIGPGDFVERGQRFGLIRFGSRVDLYLPLGCELLVKPGDRVKGGESILARLIG